MTTFLLAVFTYGVLGAIVIFLLGKYYDERLETVYEWVLWPLWVLAIFITFFEVLAERAFAFGLRFRRKK
jgi:hypothetical protein